MAYWSGLSNRLKPIINTVGDGINTAVPPRNIEDNQSPDLMNVGTDIYPALSPRRKHISIGGSGTDKLLFSHKDELLWRLSGNNIQQYNPTTNVWTTLKTFPVTPTERLDYVNFMNKVYVVTKIGKVVEIGSDGTAAYLSNSPNAKFITAHANRLYVVYDNKLHYSGLRLPNDWNTVDASGAIELSTVNGENLTGITMFSNHIVCFSKNGVYELYGTGPLNYDPLTVSTSIGCVANESVVEIKQNLLWLGEDGIYSYNGATVPKKISWAVDKYISRINKSYAHLSCAGTDDRRYYIAIPVDNSTVPNLILMYDTEVSQWYVQEFKSPDNPNGYVAQFLRFKDELHYTNGNLTFKITNDFDNAIMWHWVSKPFSDADTARRINWYRLYIIVDLPTNSTLDIYLSLTDDGEDWELLYNVTADNNLNRHKIIIPLGMAYDVDWVRIKFQGIGPCVIHEIQRYIRMKPW